MTRLIFICLFVVACSDTAGPAGRTLQVTHQAYRLVCNPVCQPITPLVSLDISASPKRDSLHVLATVPFGATRCVQLLDSAAYVFAYVQGVGTLIGVDTGKVALATAPGWRWSIRDTLFNGGVSSPSPSTFGPAPPCHN
jgi:hypothetical protein